MSEKFFFQMPWTVTGHNGINLFKRINYMFMMLCAIWFHIFNFKNVKNTPKGVLHLVKFWAEA